MYSETHFLQTKWFLTHHVFIHYHLILILFQISFKKCNQPLILCHNCIAVNFQNILIIIIQNYGHAGSLKRGYDEDKPKILFKRWIGLEELKSMLVLDDLYPKPELTFCASIFIVMHKGCLDNENINELGHTK